MTYAYAISAARRDIRCGLPRRAGHDLARGRRSARRRRASRSRSGRPGRPQLGSLRGADVERTLTQRELNRALLARQLLLERVRLPIPRALERIGGIQDQYAPNAYIRLWSCLEGFRRDDLTRALERRTVVQATLMRGDDPRRLETRLLAVRGRDPRAAARLVAPRAEAAPEEAELERQAAELRALMADGPRRHEELVEVVGRSWGMAGPWLELVRVPPSGTWEKRRAHLFQTAERWVGPEDVEVAPALDQLVRRYLGAFGPAPRGRHRASGPGVKPRDLAPRSGAARRCAASATSRAASSSTSRARRSPTPRRRRRCASCRPGTPCSSSTRGGRVSSPRSTGRGSSRRRRRSRSRTFLVDGAVAGTWRFDDGRVRWESFRRLDAGTRREVEDEAERLALLHA